MKISILGTGYVGLVTGLCFSEMGNQVWCIDNDERKIQDLTNCIPPYFEPGLEGLLQSNCMRERIRFSTSLKDSIENTDLCFIAVGTPSSQNGDADLEQIFTAAREIGRLLQHHMYIVIKSTVPVGTAEKVKQLIERELQVRDSELTFDVISNPEFLKEGSAINDCLRPDRIIIGADNENAFRVMKELYLPFVRNTENYILMDVKSAEMTKYVANAMLASRISFMNEMSNICELVGADINKVRLGIGSDKRIGYSFIYAGCGYGGSCFPKDVKALIAMSKALDYVPRILTAVEEVNNTQKHIIASKIVSRFGEDLSGLVFGIWGLSFKPDTSDIREASSLTIINDLLNFGARIQTFDPQAMNEAKLYFNNNQVQFVDSPYDALNNVDAMVLITEWKEFRSPDFIKVKSIMKQPIIFDGRNQYDATTLNEYGFEYYQIGVPAKEVIKEL